MKLTTEQVRERLEAPGNAKAINRAFIHQEKVRFHSETSLSPNDVRQPVTDFLKWVQGLIPEHKFRLFCNLFTYPVLTNTLTDDVYQALEKVFEGRDTVTRYQFVSDAFNEDWLDYRYSQGIDCFFKDEVFPEMKTAINSVLVVDMEAEQSTERPEPYPLLLNISAVRDFQINAGGAIEWIMYKDGEGRLIVLDGETYRAFQLKADSWELASNVPTIENPHPLEYCPARFMWTDCISKKEKAVKKSPLSAYLSDLDWLLFWKVSKRHLDLHAAYPIYWGFSGTCDYVNAETGDRCNGGFVQDANGVYNLSRSGTSANLIECPKCSKKRLRGPGTFVEVPAPSPDNGNADLRNPVGIVNVDGVSLEYNQANEVRLEMAVYNGVTGYAGEAPNGQAVNEKQVLAMFESRTQTLVKLANQFQLVQEWAETTICKLRYPTEFVTMTIDYGTAFYLESADSLLIRYNEARESGTDNYILDMLQDDYFETKFRKDPDGKIRAKILVALDPFRHLTDEQVQGMYRANEIQYEDYFLKLNFSSLLARFERENVSVSEFGSALSFQARIEAISKTLYSYVKPNIKGQPEPTA